MSRANRHCNWTHVTIFKRAFHYAFLLLLVGCTPSVVGSQPATGVLFEGKSEFTHLKVTEEAGIRCLVFGDMDEDKETCIDLDNPDRAIFEYTRMMFVGLLFHPTPKRVLQVGLGGGFMPMVFQRHLPDIHVDVVEIDPMVSDIAIKYFAFKPGKTLTVAVADGRDFIAKSSNKYGQIWLDAFDEEYVPPRLTTIEFLQEVKKHLTNKGVFVENLHLTHPLFRSQLATVRAAFKQVWVFRGETSDNAIVVAADTPAIEPAQFPGSAKYFNGHIGSIDLMEEAGKQVLHYSSSGARLLHD